MIETPPRGDRDEDEPPPIGGSWRTLYAIVLVNLALLIAVFALIARAYE